MPRKPPTPRKRPRSPAAAKLERQVRDDAIGKVLEVSEREMGPATIQAKARKAVRKLLREQIGSMLENFPPGHLERLVDKAMARRKQPQQ